MTTEIRAALLLEGVLLIMLNRVFLTLKSVDETPVCVLLSSTFMWYRLLCCLSVRIKVTLNIPMKPFEQYFYNAVQSGLNTCVTIQIKATEHNSHMVLFVRLYKVVLTFESVD